MADRPHPPLRLADVVREFELFREQAARNQERAARDLEEAARALKKADEQARRACITIDTLRQDRDEESADGTFLRERVEELKAEQKKSVDSARNGQEFARSDRDRAEDKGEVTAAEKEALRVASRAVLAAAKRSEAPLEEEFEEALEGLERVEGRMVRWYGRR